MKIKLKREDILKPLQHANGVVERRQTLPILSNVLLNADKERIRLCATDLEVEIQATIAQGAEKAGDISLPARKLHDIFRTLPDEAQVEIVVDQGKATIRSGRTRFTLATLPADEFPLVDDIQSAQQFEIAQKDLRNLIERTHFAMAQQDVRYYLNGLMIEFMAGTLRAVATDGHRLAMCDIKADVSPQENSQVIIPRKGILELMRLLEDSDGTVSVAIGANHIRVEMPNIVFTSKLVDGRFPDYQRVLPKGADKQLTAERDELKSALARTAILSNEKYRGIRWAIDKNTLKIQAHNPEQEEAEEELEVSYDGGGIEIGFNVTYLLDALGAIPGSRVQVALSDSNSSCLIQEPGSEQCRYVVMPMRL